MRDGRARRLIPADIFDKLVTTLGEVSFEKRRESYLDFDDRRLLNNSHYLRILACEGQSPSLELSVLFCLERRRKWHFDRMCVPIPSTGTELEQLMRRVLPASEASLKIPDGNLAQLLNELLTRGLAVREEVLQQSYSWSVGNVQFTITDAGHLGRLVECVVATGDAGAALAEILPKDLEEIRDYYGHVDICMDAKPNIYYSTATKARMFKRNPRWNLLEADRRAYEAADHAKDVWVNIHFRAYDLYVAHYIESLPQIVQNIDRLFFIYWDNLIYPDIASENEMTERNIQSLHRKLARVFPGCYSVLRLSEVKRAIDADIRRAIENIRYYIDSETLKRIIEISKPTLNIQVINNMIVDFVLCCFAERCVGRRMDVYYTGSRFQPMEPLFRKVLYGVEHMHFPEVEYVHFPPHFDDFAKRIPGAASAKAIDRTISAFFHLQPERDEEMCKFYSVRGRQELAQLVTAKLDEGRGTTGREDPNE